MLSYLTKNTHGDIKHQIKIKKCKINHSISKSVISRPEKIDIMRLAPISDRNRYNEIEKESNCAKMRALSIKMKALSTT